MFPSLKSQASHTLAAHKVLDKMNSLTASLYFSVFIRALSIYKVTIRGWCLMSQ
jgi:hypothetical protein